MLFQVAKFESNYTSFKVVFGFSCPHLNPFPEGVGAAIPSSPGLSMSHIFYCTQGIEVK